MTDYFKCYVMVDVDGFIIDEHGNPICVTDENEVIPQNYADANVINYHKPRWDFNLKEWVEGLSTEEIEEINKPKPREPTEIEILKEENEALKQEVAVNAMAMMEFMEMVTGGEKA